MKSHASGGIDKFCEPSWSRMGDGKKFWFVDPEKATPADTDICGRPRNPFSREQRRGKCESRHCQATPTARPRGSNRRARLPATLGFQISVAHEHTRSTSTGSAGAV